MKTEEEKLRDYVQAKMDRYKGIIRPNRNVFIPTHKDLRDQLNDAAANLCQENDLAFPWPIEEMTDEVIVNAVQSWLDKVWQKHVLLYITAEETRWWDMVVAFDAYSAWDDEGPSRAGRYKALTNAVDRLRHLNYLYSYSTGSDQYYRLNEQGVIAKKALQDAQS